MVSVCIYFNLKTLSEHIHRGGGVLFSFSFSAVQKHSTAQGLNFGQLYILCL